MVSIKRHALAVMRCQPVHKGHTSIINRMIEDFELVTIGLGSTGRHSEPSNPWMQSQRQDMLRNIYGNRIRIVPLQDLKSEQGSDTWCSYVLEKISSMNMGEVTDYFTGSHADAVWYKGMFHYDGVVRDKHKVSGSDVVRKLHILERSENIFPSATELRTYLTTRDDGWKRWVPAVNHELVDSSYPETFKVKKGD